MTIRKVLNTPVVLFGVYLSPDVKSHQTANSAVHLRLEMFVTQLEQNCRHWNKKRKKKEEE